ncbi:MAG: hypothetical protein ABFD49_04320 [Armatimonadota bacterium]|nr:hypothetical protein [bacterium]
MGRPNLPQLDNLEIRNRWPLAHGFNSAHPLGKIAAVLAIVESLLRGLELHQFTSYNHIAALLVFVYSIHEAFFITVYYVKSDDRGLTVNRLFRHQFMKWDNVRKVIAKKPQLYAEPESYMFIGQDQRIWLPLPSPRGRMDAVLVASIRQHLLAVGKAEDVPLPGNAEDLWWIAPDWISEEAAWTNPHPPDWRIYYKMLQVKSIIVAILLSIAIVMLGWERVNVVARLAIIVIGGLYAALYAFLFRMRTVVQWAKVDSDGVNVANGFGSFNLTWSDIKESGWDSEGLYLTSKSRRVTVRLPDNPSASNLHLCVLKKLRTIEDHKWVEVPAQLGGVAHTILNSS